VAHRVHVVLGAEQQPGRLHVGDYLAARLVAVESLVGAALGRDGGVGVEDVDLGTVVALADLEVVGVVSGRDLDRTGAEGRIDVLVGYDRDLPADEREDDGGAHDVAVALVVRVHGHARVAEHRLGPGGCDRDVVAPACRLGERVAEVPQVAVEVLVLDLDVARAPWHTAGTS
jgi:hypothetical protein